MLTSGNMRMSELPNYRRMKDDVGSSNIVTNDRQSEVDLTGAENVGYSDDGVDQAGHSG